jgi:hypothetical protein
LNVSRLYRNEIAALPFPNQVHFWLSGLGQSFSPVEIQIEGLPYPQSFRGDGSDRRTERIAMLDEGVQVTRQSWTEINRMSVRGLPEGAALKVFPLPFPLPYQEDRSRPYTHSAFRDTTFRRYWAASGSLARELYFSSRFAGYEPFVVYGCPAPLGGLAVEPNTNGLFGFSGSTLYYFDRREQMPANLEAAVNIEKSLYGIEVQADLYRPGDLRYYTN